VKIPNGFSLRPDPPLDVEELKDVVDELNEMLDNKRYAFASETLGGILSCVTERGAITEKQRRAIVNIRGLSDGNSSERTTSRRYEGYDSSRHKD
jgi:hypothetical protein